MEARDAVYRDAVAFVDAGNNSFADLLDHCLDNSRLEEADETVGYGAIDTLIHILENSGEFRVSEKRDIVVRIDALLEGLTLTHRLTADEVKHGLVEATPDLILMFLNKDRAMKEGGSIGLRYNSSDDDHYHRHGSVEGPSGWLDGYSPGDLVAVVHGPDGVSLHEVTEPEDGAAETAALLEEFEAQYADLGEPASIQRCSSIGRS